MNGVTVPREVCFEENAPHVLRALDVDAMTFVLFGATGDLAKRKIFPALYNLFLDKKLPHSFSVIGLGRREWSDERFQAHVEKSLQTFSRRIHHDNAITEEFLRVFRYSPLDVTNKESYKNLLDLVQKREEELSIPANRLYYLSVAPELVDVITSNISESGLSTSEGWKRLILEKPFGHNLKSAQQLNVKLSHAFAEDEIYCIDHYLGKPMVQNLEALAFANPVFQALWNNQYIANVQITASETVGVEERANYYDQAGAIRDMVQSHMLQMLMMTAMHLPKRISANDILHEKTKVMNCLWPLQKENVACHVVRGQYGAGEIHKETVVGYVEEPGVRTTSTTDTFVAARLLIDDSFWSGVPFYIRTGKRMREKSTRIVIEFKNPLKNLYKTEHEGTAPNLLMIQISPNEGVSLQINSKNPRNSNKFETVTVDFSVNQKDVPEAYELLLFDAFRGDPTYFANWKEVELTWKWLQPVLEAFEENVLPLHSYRSGSMGPEAAYRLLEEDGFKWW
jgi:glucose-6-phosphate 1-dehydrogenase